jgi:hypothetical protein
MEIARRWFGLRTEDEIQRFVLADPDVQALQADEATRQEVTRDFVRRITAACSGDNAELRNLAWQINTFDYLSPKNWAGKNVVRLTLQQRACLLGLRRGQARARSRTRAAGRSLRGGAWGDP